MTVKPASTEVISSLIETLSAISSPAEQHFDSLPRLSAPYSTPVSPRPWQTDFPMINEPGEREVPQGDRLSVQKRPHGVDATYLLHPDRASIGTSSPRGSRSIPEKGSHIHVREPEDPYDLGEIYSIGNVSIQPQPWQSETSVNSTGSDATRSVRSHISMRSLRSLRFKSSRDSLHSTDEKVVRKSGHRKEDRPQRLIIRDTTPPPIPSPDPIEIVKRNARKSVVAEPIDVPERGSTTPSRGRSRRLYWSPEEVASGNRSPHNLPNQNCIPTRGSSKRHSINMSSTYRKDPSHHSNQDIVDEANNASIADNKDTLQAALQKIADAPPIDVSTQSEAAEDSVRRRIKELKEQKLQRERSSLESPTAFLSAPETPVRSPTPSALPAESQPSSASFANVENGYKLNNGGTSLEANDTEESAPSPAIASKTKRNSLIGSRPQRDPVTATNNEKKRRSFSAPQRSNSRLMRRLSRPVSPTSAAKHRSIFSNQANEPLFDQLEIEDQDSVGDAVDDFLSAPRLNQKVKHAQTGRVIAFSEVGDPDGSVVFCCVGMGLTRFLTAFYDELALTLKLRLITPDRPGVGGSEVHVDGVDTPLGWADDVRAICEHLKITKFSIMAHSAGAIYALATVLRMSQHIRCRVHLLAPWIPPSQMSVIGAQQEPLPAASIPYSQRILRALPTTFLKAANSSFLSTTSASITTSLPKSPRRNKANRNRSEVLARNSDELKVEADQEVVMPPQMQKNETDADSNKESRPPLVKRSTSGNPIGSFHNAKDRTLSYEARLTEAIWEAATTGANPAVDLLVCLERRQPIGFRYVDITRAVVIHHGSKDTRVPVENAKWLGNTMRRCQVRVLEGEGHGLMASAGVMGNVLMEMASEWDDWNRVVRGKGGMERRVTNNV